MTVIVTRTWFQSTHPRGVRRQKFHQKLLHNVVSIHAPAWGATRPAPRPFDKAKSFNPRTRVGCDIFRPYDNHQSGWFQSTHPRGVRLLQVTSPKRLPRSFNPRTRVGCDIFLIGRPAIIIGFNPRTRVGCDMQGLARMWNRRVFQSTHPRGVRHSRASQQPPAAMFQSTHPRGVRPRQKYE